MLASIPNLRNWWLIYRLVIKGDFSYTDTGLLDRTHLRWFTRSTMLNLFTESGFRVEKIIPINLSDHPLMRLVRVFLPRIGRELSALQYVVIARSANG